LSRIQSSIIALILLGLAGYVGLLLFANLNATGTQNVIKSWQKKGVVPGEDSWQESLGRIQSVIKSDPDNPEYLASEAQLYRVRARMFDPQSSQSIAANRQALSKYQHLLSLRPSWAPYWGNIIGIKYELWEYDELMIKALRNAARLAPWFKTNQHIILQAGFHGWAFIDVETRGVVDKTLERAMLLQPKETIKFAKEQGFSEWLEPYLEANEKL